MDNLEKLKQMAAHAKSAQPVNRPVRNRNCISYWLPKLVELGIPVPETRLHEVEVDDLWSMADGKGPGQDVHRLIKDLKQSGTELGYPAFLRTGYTSGKHDWLDHCFVSGENDLNVNRIYRLFEFNEIGPGLPAEVWALRKFLRPRAWFNAFRQGTPITTETRTFVRDGKCHFWHPYWPPHAIEGHNPTVANWRELLAQSHAESIAGHAEVCEMSAEISKSFDGGWSIDWLLDQDQGWVLIDMAMEATSFKWKGFEAA